VCFDLIDPFEGDEHAALVVSLAVGGDHDQSSLNLCESCRPESATAHLNWLIAQMEVDGGASS
jgi:hypothetical protein